MKLPGAAIALLLLTFSSAAYARDTIEVDGRDKVLCSVQHQVRRQGQWEEVPQTACSVEYKQDDDLFPPEAVQIVFSLTPRYGADAATEPVRIGFYFEPGLQPIMQPFSIRVPLQIGRDLLDQSIVQRWRQVASAPPSTLGNAADIWESVLWAHMTLRAHLSNGDPMATPNNATPQCPDSQNPTRRGRLECLRAIVSRGCDVLTSTSPTRVAVAISRWRGLIGVCSAISREAALAQVAAAQERARDLQLTSSGEVRDPGAAYEIVSSAVATRSLFNMNDEEFAGLTANLDPLIRSPDVAAYAQRFERASIPDLLRDRRS